MRRCSLSNGLNDNESSALDGQVGKGRVTANICTNLRTERRHVFMGTVVVWC